MIFKEKLTTKQYQSIFFIILGILIIYLSFQDIQEFKEVVVMFAIMLIGISMMIFFEDTIKKYKIVRAHNSKNYDSKAEEKIAKYLERKNIKFFLHPVIKLPKNFWFFQIPFINVKIRPDFFLPEYNIYVEYWGLINDPEYKKRNFDFKKKIYKNNRVDFISLYPKNLNNLDWNFTQKLLEILKGREGINRHWK